MKRIYPRIYWLHLYESKYHPVRGKGQTEKHLNKYHRKPEISNSNDMAYGWVDWASIQI